MRRRALVLLLLVAVLGGGAWALRGNGILLGRDTDGPLEANLGTASGPQRPGEIGYLVDFVFGDGVELESVAPARMSPGLELLGPVLFERERAGRITSIKRWPPRGSRPFASGTRIDERMNVGFGARAQEPGFYHLAGMRYRYRKGLRRFDEVDGTRICFDVSPRFVNRCPEIDDRIARAEGLAEIGGPSDYGGAKFLLPDRGFGDDGVQFAMRRGGELRFTITISNLSGEDREVPRLDLGRRDPTFSDPLDPLPSEPPAPFTIPAGGARKVTIRASFVCEGRSGDGYAVYDAIEAGDDDVELSMPVRVGGRCRSR